MDELKKALYALVKQAGLSEAEATKLTLNDLHLAGAEPNVDVVDGQSGRRRTIRLNDWARNAVVTWMLQRPDRPVMLLFPGDDDKGFSAAKITELLRGYTLPDLPVAGSPPPSRPIAAERVAEEGLPTIRPGLRRAPPPPFKVVGPPMGGPERISVASRPETIAASRPETVKIKPMPAVSAVGPPPLTANEGVSSDAKPAPFRTGPVAAPPPPQRQPAAPTRPRRTSFVPVMAGLLALLACGGLIWGAYSTRPDLVNNLLGRGEPEDGTPLAELDVTVTTEEQAAPVSPVETPSPEPAETPTPVSTDTPTPLPEVSNTPTLEPTESPTLESTATATPEPTETPTPEPSATSTSAPTNTPAPATPTQAAPSGFKYGAPRLISPEQDFRFIQGNTVDLQWEDVPGGLADNERYAVRLVYYHATEVTYKGADVTETIWTVPLELYHQADGPEFKYAWYVYVEQVQADGTGVAVSPESPPRQFSWE